jgi:hypothetical protein
MSGQPRVSISEDELDDPQTQLNDEENETPRLNIDPNRFGRSHFFFGKTLGEGAYARVVHAKLKSEDSPEFAIKIMDKSHIQRERKVRFCYQ